MTSALKPDPAPIPPKREKGIRVFTYPKIIFIFPTFVVSLICGIGMLLVGDRTSDPIYEAKTNNEKIAKAEVEAAGTPAVIPAPLPVPDKVARFETPQNLLGVLFVAVFVVNLLVMALDFPRFTIVALIFFFLFGIFLTLWVGAFFDIDLLKTVRVIFSGIYAYANSGFYFSLTLAFGMMYIVILLTRYLDYWEIHPNEILHHHGPLSDLERYPTHNLKFDKEIPDVLEHLFLGAGKIVLHLPTERKSIVLENVLFINRVEESLKSLMSRMDVRLASDPDSVE